MARHPAWGANRRADVGRDIVGGAAVIYHYIFIAGVIIGILVGAGLVLIVRGWGDD